MIVMGLTGSVGMGKSTAAKMLQEMDVPVHDADACVHALLEPSGAGFEAVAKTFPTVVQDGRIDRKALGQIVFTDPAQKKKLEQILHPLVREKTDAFVEDHRQQGAKLVVLDIPLLFETGRDRDMDVTLCMTASADTQRQRVLSRAGMTPERFEQIVASQIPDAEKRARSDYVVSSDLDLEQMREALAKIVQSLVNAPSHGV